MNETGTKGWEPATSSAGLADHNKGVTKVLDELLYINNKIKTEMNQLNESIFY